MKNQLAVTAFNINSYGSGAFSVAAPLLWNISGMLDHWTFLKGS